MTERLLKQARRPTYDGTETVDEQSWGDVPKTLEFWASALGFQGIDSVDDLSNEQRQAMASTSLLGDTDADTFAELIFFPVVNPDTQNLSEGALRAVLSGRGEQADISDEQLESAQTIAENLLVEEFDMEPSDEESDSGIAGLEAREVSLDDILRTIHHSFYEQHDDIENGVEFFVQEVFQETLIAYTSHEDTLYRVGYEAQVEGDDIAVVFDSEEQWVAVEQTYVPVDEDRAHLEQKKEHMVGEQRDERPPSGPYIKKSPRETYARHCRRRGATYFRDFASWDGPAPKMKRSDTADGTRTEVTINAATEDRHGTLILPDAARLDPYNEDNPIVLINHDHDLAAGTSSVGIQNSGSNARLRADMPDAAWDRQDPAIERWFNKVSRDPPIVRSASIGALFHEVVPGREYDGIEEFVSTEDRRPRDLPDVVTDWTLVEWSWVSVPSNPDATIGLGEIDRVVRQAETRIQQVTNSFTEKNGVPTDPESPSQPTGQDGDGGAESDHDGSGEKDGARPRRLSDEEARLLIKEGFEERRDRATGRK